ncbi:cupin domain-containing protein [Streptomyces sp. NPDC006923]|uniref:cupin domain-containing protein n=1 Tax=Streptomyces sp. NPDC006923 TaxID=3155355 RepID=UPI003400CEBD
MAQSPHVRSLMAQPHTTSTAAGTIGELTQANFTALSRLSIRRLVLAPLAVREPHWHANANELSYCVRGEALVSMSGNGNEHHSFTIAAGQMFFVPSGALHHIENTGREEAEFITGFSHERPEDFGMSGAFGAMTDAVLGNTYDLPASAFSGLRRGPADTNIGTRQAPAQIPPDARRKDPYKFDVDAMPAPVASAAGSARIAKTPYWPVLENISMNSLRITDEGMREPHWHPLTAEMGYVHEGRGRMTLLSPGGEVDTYLLSPGDVYFVPRAYPHHIEDIGEGELHFLVFFDRSTPGNIGYKASVGGFSKEVLAASFGITPDDMADLPFTPEDPLLVSRRNPVDPVR